MPVEPALVQFRKTAGSQAIGSVTLQGASSGNPAFSFFGKGVGANAGLPGYVLPPLAANALGYPVARGSTSWEVWVAMRFNGFAFGAITNVVWFIDSIDPTGLGTLPDGSTVAYEVPRGTSIDRTGVTMRAHPTAIQKGVSPLEPRRFIPASAPRFGLPLGEDPVPLFAPGIGNGLDITPVQSSDSLGIDPGEQIGERVILEGNLEPRYSNAAVMSMVLSEDATAAIQTRNPFVFGASWLES